SLGELYTEVGNAVLDSTDEVPSMFHDRPPRHRRTSRSTSGAGAGTAAAAAGGGAARKRGGGLGGGRAVLDVALPGADVQGPSLAASTSGSSSGKDFGKCNGSSSDDGGDDDDGGYDDRDRHVSASRERWTREWNRAIGAGDGDDGHGPARAGGDRRNGHHQDAAAASVAVGVENPFTSLPRGKRRSRRRAAPSRVTVLENEDGGRLLAAAAAAAAGEGRGGGLGSTHQMQYGFETIGRGRGPVDEEEEEEEEEESGYGGSSEGTFEPGAGRWGGVGGSQGRHRDEEEKGEEEDEEDEEDEEEEDDNSETGSEGVGVSGLPIGEASLSSGDERIWRAAGSRA
ncbi:unnamed protein product, partial [Ectocarpus sp. 12 AP-2014]